MEVEELYLLEKGSGGQVMLGRHLGQLVALKKFWRRNGWKQELLMMSQLRHPHIVFPLFYIEQEEEWVVATEYALEGSLWDSLYLHKCHLSPAVILSLLFQVIKAFIYLHNKLILHNDLKTSNLLLFHNHTLKVSDFGSATFIK